MTKLCCVCREEVCDLLTRAELGTFLVRRSTTNAGAYALSVSVPAPNSSSGRGTRVPLAAVSHYLVLRTSSGGYRLKGVSKEWPSLLALVVHLSVLPEILPCPLRLPALLGVGAPHGPSGAARFVQHSFQLQTNGPTLHVQQQTTPQAAQTSRAGAGGGGGGGRQRSSLNPAPTFHPHASASGPRKTLNVLVPASNSAFSSVHPVALVGGAATDVLGGGIPSLVRASAIASSRDTLNEVVNANFVADENAGAALDGEDDFFDDDEADRESDYHRLTNFTSKMAALGIR